MTKTKGYIKKPDRRHPNRPWFRCSVPGFKFLEPFNPKGPDYTIQCLKSSLSKYNKRMGWTNTWREVKVGYQILTQHKMVEVFAVSGQDKDPVSQGPARRNPQPFFFGSFGLNHRWTVRLLPADEESSQYPAHELRRRILKASYTYAKRKGLKWKLSAAIIDNGRQVECIWTEA